MHQPSGLEQVAIYIVELVRMVKRQNKLQARMGHLVASMNEHGCKHAEDHQGSAEQGASPCKHNPVTITIRAPRQQVRGLAIVYSASCVSAGGIITLPLIETHAICMQCSCTLM